MAGFKTNSTIASCGGKLLKLNHESKVLKSAMDVNVFLPPAAVDGKKKVPVLFFLSGLTCTPQNCSEKGFFQSAAAQHGIAIVYPDTSPRGSDHPGENDSWDFGSGAGFYINATEKPWSDNYNMYDYVVSELPEALFEEFPQLDADRVSITGHSMGGHGALTLFLRNPGKYKSVSAFSPISNPINAPWGIKAFSGYFGEQNKAKWAEHDATELIKKYSGPSPEILIDVGTGDQFYKDKQLLPENLVEAANDSANYKGKVNLRLQPDYDHSYYFISSFAKDHVEHAAKYLL
ncbi:S-formylglutathione hydrolase [Sugiyamaella lignohabitans]|uniref:S-formylglutathione hydrolase n=1 Tax=Sugiyamaella lignohabitans TaxID=796027 RepID=A0A167C5Y1_9ASCO|nr:S-formylglutathione hydrolase [Sugiyamaella lignohabitans]ANB11260.1 S-formylglutathione hydrolase [Sugiyamaella lignohabitans]